MLKKGYVFCFAENVNKYFVKHLSIKDKILKKEKDLVELRLNEAISMEIYQEKYNEIAISKEKLLEEKRTLEVTLTDEKALKKRLEGFKKLLESNKYLEEFDRTVFESIVDKIVTARFIGCTLNTAAKFRQNHHF